MFSEQKEKKYRDWAVCYLRFFFEKQYLGL